MEKLTKANPDISPDVSGRSRKMPTGKRWKKGRSGNPAGGPLARHSWKAIIRAVGDMDIDDILALIGAESELGKAISNYPRGVKVKYLVIARVFLSLMDEPTAGLWNGLMDRAEGKVPNRV